MKLVLILWTVMVLAGGAAGGLALYPWLFAQEPAKAKEAGERADFIKISPQAQHNLKLKPKKLTWKDRDGKEHPQPVPVYWRTVKVPGQVVEREGNCDRLVSAKVAGVVTHIAAVRGDLVKPGAPLFTLEIVSESLQTAQAAYYKNHLELEFVHNEIKRLEKSINQGAVPMARQLELDNQEKKFKREKTALEHELDVRGFSEKEIRGVAAGTFVRQVTVGVPSHAHPTLPPLAKGGKDGVHVAGAAVPPANHEDFRFEVEDLKVKLGEYVQAGQALCLLAHHERLQIEGRAFEAERPLLQRAAKEGWHVKAEFPHQNVDYWPAAVDGLKIAFFENKLDARQGLQFYLPLPNQYVEFETGKEKKQSRLWRFRPGQRVHLLVPVQKYQEVFVLPAAAVVREGPEAYIFRQNGDVFVRMPVHVLHEDRQEVIVADDDGNILEDYLIAQSGAAQLNWALKAQAGGEEGGHSHTHPH